MGKVVELAGCKCAINIKALAMVDVDSGDKKVVRLFMPGLSMGYNINHNSEEDALRTFEGIVKEMKETND